MSIEAMHLIQQLNQKPDLEKLTREIQPLKIEQVQQSSLKQFIHTKFKQIDRIIRRL